MTTPMAAPALRLDANPRDCVDGLFIVDSAHRYVEFSAVCERITGLSRESVLGSQCSCQLPTDCRAERERSLLGALCPGLRAFSDEDGLPKQRIRFRRPDGHSVSVEITFSRIASGDGDSSYLVGIMREVTDVLEDDADEPRVTNDTRDVADFDLPGDGPTAPEDASLGALDRILCGIERDEIVRALRRSGGQRMMAARVLGISRSRLYRRMDALGIDPRRVAASLNQS